MDRDVRMRGFSERTAVADALAILDRRVAPLGEETAALGDLAGRVLAREVVAPVDVPAFRRAAMDGYAVVAEDTFGATPDDPRVLDVVGESLPARPSAVEVREGQCVRIMTGAPMPAGATAVVPVEHTETRSESVHVAAAFPPGKHVGDVGEDTRAGTRVMGAGRRLRPQDVGLLSSLGLGEIAVVRRPRVVLLVTGDELLPPGTPPAGPRITDANSPMLEALCQRDGAGAFRRWHVPDESEAVGDQLTRSAAEADLVLVSGGSSVGQEDHAPRALRELGELTVHGMAMRPSSPAGFGFLESTPIFLLPGNPVSCLCAYDFFAGRALRIRGGLGTEWPYRTVRLSLRRKITSLLGRTDYVRVSVEDGGIEPLAIRGASILSSTVRAHGFVVVPPEREGYAEGTVVPVHLYG